MVQTKHEKNDLKRIEFDTKLKPLEPLRFCKWVNFVYTKLYVRRKKKRRGGIYLLLRLPFVYNFFFVCLRVYIVFLIWVYVCSGIYKWLENDMDISCRAAKETREHDKMQFEEEFFLFLKSPYCCIHTYAISFRDLNT